MISAAALTAFAYRASRDSLDEQATLSVVAAAQGREQALSRLLSNRHDRMDAFATTLESLCGERTPSGRFGWERECVRVVLRGFETAERIQGIELKYGGRAL